MQKPLLTLGVVKIRLIIILLALCQGCSNSSLKEISINELDSIQRISGFNFREIAPELVWSHVLILDPYTEVKAIDKSFELNRTVIKVLNQNKLNDRVTTLIWYRDKKNIGFTTVDRKIMDFSIITQNKAYCIINNDNQTLYVNENKVTYSK